MQRSSHNQYAPVTYTHAHTYAGSDCGHSLGGETSCAASFPSLGGELQTTAITSQDEGLLFLKNKFALLFANLRFNPKNITLNVLQNQNKVGLNPHSDEECHEMTLHNNFF